MIDPGHPRRQIDSDNIETKLRRAGNAALDILSRRPSDSPLLGDVNPLFWSSMSTVRGLYLDEDETVTTADHKIDLAADCTVSTGQNPVALFL